VVRPGFLALMSVVSEAAATRGGTRRIEVGETWSFPARSEVALGTSERADVRIVQGVKRVTPREAGRYDLRIDGVSEARFAMIPEREIDLRQRALVAQATAKDAGSTTAWVDLSRYVALLLLGLLAGEMVLRLFMTRATTQVPSR